jgi:hypothetical protein
VIQFSDSYALFPEAQAILDRLVTDEDQFAHVRLAQARIVCIASARAVMLHGQPCDAVISDGNVQAIQPVKGLCELLISAFVHELHEGETPDYLVFFDAARWSVKDDLRRERLVFHELCHLQQKLTRDGDPAVDDQGRPRLALVPHDYEFFGAELERYGVVTCDLDAVVPAIVTGQANAAERQRRADDEAQQTRKRRRRAA